MVKEVYKALMCMESRCYWVMYLGLHLGSKNKEKLKIKVVGLQNMELRYTLYNRSDTMKPK